jgi:hypothetical protein
MFGAPTVLSVNKMSLKCILTWSISFIGSKTLAPELGASFSNGCANVQNHHITEFMKRIIVRILLGLLVATTCAKADTSLTITSSSPFGCLQNAFILPTPLQVSGSFSLNGVSGTGVIRSSVTADAPTFSYPPNAYFFNYSIDLSGMPSATTHCVKLLIHFGTPDGCGYNEVFGSPAAIQSATLAPFGDITFVFGGGCLEPGQPSVGFLMFSEALPKTNVVTVIDDYIDPVSGHTNEARINVPAIVPDIPPNPPPWIFYYPAKIPFVFFQGLINSNNPAPPLTNGFVSGTYDFTLQLLTAASNGLAASGVVTQTVQVANGLFNVPLPFDPIAMGDGSVRWLSIGVRPSNLPAVQFTPLSPLPITPAPQAYYAYTAGAVADLTPGQAVTSLNGLTDAVNLQAGAGIVLGTNGNTLTVSALPGVPSDRNLKTGFAPVQPDEILARLAALPIKSWRYTNELAGVHHLGPMAQDFQAAFGLGTDNRMIYFVDEEGVALAAIQGLNQKLDEKDSEIKELQAQINELKLTLKQSKQPQAEQKH